MSGTLLDVLNGIFFIAFTLVWGWFIVYLNANKEAWKNLRLERETQAKLNTMRQRWLRAHPAPDFGPVEVVYVGDDPLRPYTIPERGMLGITDRQIVLVGESSGGFVLSWPLDEVRGFNVVAYTLLRETPAGRWQMHTFSKFDHARHFAEALHTLGGVPISEARDPAPIQAQQMVLTMTGFWDTSHTATLILTPERVLSGGRTAVLLADIRGISLLDAPGSAVLLRLDIVEPDQPCRVIGFVLPLVHAQLWAREIGLRTGIPVQRASGRKKKA